MRAIKSMETKKNEKERYVASIKRNIHDFKYSK